MLRTLGVASNEVELVKEVSVGLRNGQRETPSETGHAFARAERRADLRPLLLGDTLVRELRSQREPACAQAIGGRLLDERPECKAGTSG